MNLSPTSSPRRGMPEPSISNSRKGAPPLPSRIDNQTPVRHQAQIPSASYMSPRPPSQPRPFLRTHSSPSVIDASPKLKDAKLERRDSNITPSPTSVSGATFSPRINGNHKSELTPVTSNARRLVSVLYSDDSQNNLEQISVPDSRGFKRPSIDLKSPNIPSTLDSNMIIRPRKDVNSVLVDRNNGQSLPMDLRPISPPSWPIRRTFTSGAEVGTVERYSSPYKRNSSPYLRQSGATDERCSSPYKRYSSPYLRQSPSVNSGSQNIFLDRSNQVEEEPCATGQTSSPRKTMSPYQPSLDERLADIGVERNHSDSIFLNPHHHNSVDHSHETIDTASSASVPSIHLATNLRSETLDCLTFYSMEEDTVTMDEDTSMDGIQPEAANANLFLGGVAFLPASKEKNSSRASSRVNDVSRYMTPEKEREVYEWLHSLEVDKDNNEYVAEAASSKFLTGKMDGLQMENSDIDMEMNHDVYFHEAALLQPSYDVARTNSLTFEPASYVEPRVEAKKPQTKPQSPRPAKKQVAVAPAARSRGNKEVMGINVNLYGRKHADVKKPASRVMLRSRAAR